MQYLKLKESLKANVLNTVAQHCNLFFAIFYSARMH